MRAPELLGMMQLGGGQGIGEREVIAHQSSRMMSRDVCCLRLALDCFGCEPSQTDVTKRKWIAGPDQDPDFEFARSLSKADDILRSHSVHGTTHGVILVRISI